MAIRFRVATPSAALLLVALVLLVLTVVSCPITRFSHLGKSGSTSYGVFGYCGQSSCSNVRLGYDVGSSSLADTFKLSPSSRTTLSNILIFHVIATGLTLLMFLCCLLAHLHSAAHSSKFLLFIIILSIPTVIAAALAFIADILMFIPNTSWGTWVTLVSTILALIASILMCVGRRRVSARKSSRRRIADNPDMSGANYFAQQSRKDHALANLDKSTLPAFAEFEVDKTASRESNHTAEKAATNDSSPSSNQSNEQMPTRAGYAGSVSGKSQRSYSSAHSFSRVPFAELSAQRNGQPEVPPIPPQHRDLPKPGASRRPDHYHGPPESLSDPRMMPSDREYPRARRLPEPPVPNNRMDDMNSAPSAGPAMAPAAAYTAPPRQRWQEGIDGPEGPPARDYPRPGGRGARQYRAGPSLAMPPQGRPARGPDGAPSYGGVMPLRAQPRPAYQPGALESAAAGPYGHYDGAPPKLPYAARNDSRSGSPSSLDSTGGVAGPHMYASSSGSLDRMARPPPTRRIDSQDSLAEPMDSGYPPQPTSPTGSVSSHFTSVSQRGVNPRWQGSPSNMYAEPAMTRPMNRRPDNMAQLARNPDFALPTGPLSAGGARARGRGRAFGAAPLRTSRPRGRGAPLGRNMMNASDLRASATGGPMDIAGSMGRYPMSP